MYTGKKQEAEKGMVEQVVLKLTVSLKNTSCQNFGEVFTPKYSQCQCNQIFVNYLI